jgi:capsid portal protein
MYFTEDDFIKKKHKNIPNIEKYMYSLKGVSNFGMFFLII